MLKNDKWLQEVDYLNSILKSTGLDSAIKWGADVYMHSGKNIVSLGGFKNYFALIFFHGKYLKDKAQVLTNALEDKTNAMRQWRFTSIEQIDPDLIADYIAEAVDIEISGITKTKPTKVELLIPSLLAAEFSKNPDLASKFHNLAPYKRKDFILHLDSAKREETKRQRLDKILTLIEEGRGLNDKYLK